MTDTDDDWKTALNSACRTLESYAHQGKLSTSEERRIALDDALQHAVGILRIRKWRRQRKGDAA
jgi:hypothetical protein